MHPSRATAATDDLSTLAWVHEELRKSLEAAHKALRRYLRDAEAASSSDLDDVDPAVLRTARQQIHQSMGVLELVNIPEGAMLLRASEALVQRFVAKPQRLDAAAAAAIEKASHALLDYLGRRLAGKPVQALGLFPALRTLLELNGAERIHPADLWVNDWRWRPVAALQVRPRAPDAAMLATVERRLLSLVRAHALDQAVALRSDCCAIAASLAAGGGGAEAVTLWRIAGGFFEAWAMDLLPRDVFVKRTGSRVLGQLRSTAKGDLAVSERLAQDLLFYCARAVMPPGAASPCLHAVRQGYGLEPSTDSPGAGAPAVPIPIDYNEALYGRFEPAALAQARKRVEAAKQAFATVAGAELHRLELLAEPFALVQESLARLYPSDCRLGDALLAVARRTATGGRVPEAAVAMEVATSLLFLDATLEDGDFDQSEGLERLRHLAGRLHAVAGGAAAEPLEPWMEALYRRVSDRHTLGSVVHELRVRLQEVERQLDQYFRRPDDVDMLSAVPGALADMRGVFTVLGIDPAMETVSRMRDDVLSLAHLSDGLDADSPDSLLRMHRLAGNLGALGFLVDMLHVQPQLAKALFIFDTKTGLLAPLMGRHAAVPDLVDRAQAIAEAAQRDELPLGAVAEDLSALASQPSIQAQPDLVASLNAARAAIEEAATDGQTGHQGAAREHFVEAMNDFVSAATSPMPFDPLEPSFSRPAPLDEVRARDADLAADPELREVFLEEAREVVGQARGALGALAVDPGDVGQLTLLRRAFHTLKGSARMVGLGRFGEAAWACEQLYNHWTAQATAATPALTLVSGDAVDYFGAWTEAIALGDPARFAPESVIASAQALRLADEVIRIALPEGAVTGAAPEMADVAAVVEAPADAHAHADTQVLDLEIPDAEHAPVMESLAASRPMALDDWHAPASVDLHLDDVPALAALTAVVPAALPMALTPLPLSQFLPADLSLDLTPAAAVASVAPDAPVDISLDGDTLAGVDAAEAPAETVADEAFRVVGPMRIPAELFSIYTAEADEGSRLLVAELDEWALEPQRTVAESTVALAHTLGGSSATVGYDDVCDLARALEAALERSGAHAPITVADLGLFQEAAQEIRRLLQQFAAGFLREPDDELRARLKLWPAELPAAAVTEPAALPAPVQMALEPTPALEPDELGEPVPALSAQPALESGVAAEAEARPAAPPEPFEPAEPLAPTRARSANRWSALASAAAALVGIGKRSEPAAAALVPPDAVPSDEPAFTNAEVAIAFDGDMAASDAAAAARDASAEADPGLAEEALVVVPGVALSLQDIPDLTRHKGRPVHPDLVADEAPEVAVNAAAMPAEAQAELARAAKPLGDAAPVPEVAAAPSPLAVSAAPLLTNPLPVLDEVVAIDDAELLQGLAIDAPEVTVVETVVSVSKVAPDVAPDIAPVLRAPGRLELIRPEPVRPEPVVLRDVVVLEALQTDIDQRDQVDAELFPVFEEEAEDLLPQLAHQVQAWQARPQDQEAGSACMRLLHTFKGGARLAGAMRLGEMAHRCESAIQVLMNREHVDPDDLNALQGRIDTLTHTFERLSRQQAGESLSGFLPMSADTGGWSTRAGPLGDYTADTASDDAGVPMAAGTAGSADGTRARAMADARHAATGTSGPATPPVPIDWARLSAAKEGGIDGATVAAPSAADRPAPVSQPVRVRIQVLDRLVNLAGEVNITRARLDSEVGQIRGSLVDLSDNLDRLNQQLNDIALQADTQLQSRREAARVAAQDFDPLELDRYTRLQELTRILAESVNDVATVRSTLHRTLQTTEDELAVQARLTRELQSDLLRTRMVEFESLSERLYRVVRQAAKETGKLVRLDLVGGSIEVDRSVLDRMVPAFEHLLRNCVSHGIELPGVRQDAGKDPTGSVLVTVEQEGNEVTVEVRDDGSGLDLPGIRARAEAMGLVVPDATLADKDLAQLILAPGLSTASAVTELSGRGVGMDVVRADVQAMGGRIEIRTDAGHGTRFKLVLPLTTVVTQVVMLRSGTAMIAVPSNLIELVQRATPQAVETAYRESVYLYGGLRLPFFWLGALLGQAGIGSLTGRTQPVVVLRAAQHRIALHVDDVQGTHEVVVKNLGPQLAGMPGLSGLTMLPSGQVASIYNPVTLAALYGDQAHAMANRALDGPVGIDLSPLPTAVPQAALVLVVDDSLTVRRVTKRLLEREGYRVALAKDGLEALELLGDERPVVVLSDIEMPRMDGFDLLRNIRSDALLSDLPVLMITSRIAEKHRDHALRLGANHYLGKPYSEDELLSLIGRYAPLAKAGVVA